MSTGTPVLPAAWQGCSTDQSQGEKWYCGQVAVILPHGITPLGSPPSSMYVYVQETVIEGVNCVTSLAEIDDPNIAVSIITPPRESLPLFFIPSDHPLKN